MQILNLLNVIELKYNSTVSLMRHVVSSAIQLLLYNNNFNYNYKLMVVGCCGVVEKFK